MSSLELLGAALAKAQAEMPPVKFDSTNPFLKNRYATLGAVIETSRPILAKHGLAIAQFPVSSEGEVQVITSDADKPDTQVTTHRKGVVSVGIRTVLMHESGQSLESSILLPMIKEKGKSEAQVAGSVFSYLRRYAWASVLGIYADEDTDGNDTRGGSDDDASFDRARPSRSVSPSPHTAQPVKPAPTPKPQPAPASSDTKGNLVAALRRLCGPNENGVLYWLKNRKNDNGKVALMGAGLEDLSVPWLEYLVKEWAKVMPEIDEWVTAKAGLTPERAAREPEYADGMEALPVDEPAPVDEAAGAWRTFKMPFGKEKGKELGKLDRKYLYGLALNYTVELEYKGQPRKPEMIAADRQLRAMLDQCAAEHNWNKQEEV